MRLTPATCSVLLTASLLAACGDDTVGAPTAATSNSVASTATASTTVAPTTSSAPSLRLLGLGDSYPAGLGCDAPCRSYVALAAIGATEALGRPVSATNLATSDSLTTSLLLRRLTYDDSYMSAVRDADIIVVQVGNNDWQGPCVAAGHEECLESGRARVETTLSDVLAQIAKLRDGATAAVRVVTYYNASIGDSGIAGPWAFENTPENMSAFQQWFAAALDELDDTICAVAVANDAVCVDVRDAFNGPAHDEDAGPLLGGDHFHPGAEGHQAIADQIVAAGFAPAA